MKVKTYKHRSLQEGLQDIKRDLGSDAVILGTRSVSLRSRFGLFKKPTWEITAAVDDKKAVAAVYDRPQSESQPSTGAIEPQARQVAASASSAVGEAQARQRAAVTNDRRYSAKAAVAGSVLGLTAAPPPVIVTAPGARDQRMDTLIDEISELKKTFRTLSKVIPATEPDGLRAELIRNGLDRDLADHFVSVALAARPVPGIDLRECVRRLITDQLIIAPAAELHARTRVVSVFVGSTGVGKTTTIAKVAGHAAIKQKKKVALISTDTCRIGGQEQLIRFGELLGVPTYAFADISALKDLVASLGERDLILIDTPGLSPTDTTRFSKLESITSMPNAKVHLVMGATMRSEDITKNVMRFQRFKPNSVIFTKVDETESRGQLTADLLRNEIPVSYITNGQRVPEDLIIPSADEFARHVLPVEP